VGELCRNAAIVGLQTYGRRSEGKIRRLGEEGPRLLGEADRSHGGDPKTIFNELSLQVAKEVAAPQFDPGRWQAIQRQMDERGRVQRGIARAKDPARYPLACRLVDLSDGCGAILYGRTNQGRAVYTCGRYMRTAASECSSNTVDGEAMLRFTLGTLRQLVDLHGSHERLRAKLLERARRDAGGRPADPRDAKLARLRERHGELGAHRATIEYRMARERDDNLHAALARQYREAQADSAGIDESISRLESERASVSSQAPEELADAALALLDDVARVTADQASRAQINPLLQRLGLRIGLTFGDAVKGKKRVVRRLVGGRMVFGNTPLPVPLFGGSNAEEIPRVSGPDVMITTGAREGMPTNLEAPVAAQAGQGYGSCDVIDHESRREQPGTEAVGNTASAPGCTQVAARLIDSQLEGISTTKVCRGERIRTSDLLNPI
jgi:hypothetical protein